jgi:hypothetical protein
MTAVLIVLLCAGSVAAAAAPPRGRDGALAVLADRSDPLDKFHRVRVNQPAPPGA